MLDSGKMNRGMTVLSTWRLLLGDKEATEEDQQLAIILAWCVEWVKAMHYFNSCIHHKPILY